MTGTPDAYCELHAHTNFSFLDGASHPEELIARAALLGMPSLAITDHGGLYAAVRTWKAAQETETDAARAAGLSPVRPIIGLDHVPRTDEELRLAHRGRRLNLPSAWRAREPRLAGGVPRRPHPGRSPRPAGAGRRRLHRALPPASRGHLAGEKQFPVFERELVEAALDDARGHLFGLSGCRNGEVPRRCLPASTTRHSTPHALGRALRRDDFAIELSTTSSPMTTGW